MSDEPKPINMPKADECSALCPTPYRVLRYQRETDDTFTLTMEPESGDEALRFAPGQFNMLYAFPTGDVPISVSGAAADRKVLVHTIRAVGPVTRALSTLRRGDSVLVRGPFGTPWPVEQAEDHDMVIIAGGIGLAPLRPVIYHLLAHRSRYRRVSLLYGARTPSDVLYPKQLAAWKKCADLQVEVTVDRGDPSWHGDVGVVTQLIDRAATDPSRTVAMICGPEVMMHYCRLALSQRGIAAKQIYLSMERNMKCGVGSCGHCQLGPFFLCKDGPVLDYERLGPVFSVKEL
ncbi:MAG TPA: FAD/NAD(P)-binding protein [Pseudomonadota bacterium]|nr:FAD/NAD(P)-binding protein [Pseudomonadota bacterium]